MPNHMFTTNNSEDRFKFQEEDARSTSASSEGYHGGSGYDSSSSCAGLGESPGTWNREPILLIEPPPGLSLPTGTPCSSNFKPPPGLEAPSDVMPVTVEYTVQGFRREATNILRELKLHKNVGLAVSQIRRQGVPHHRQAAEFADLLTMALEETRGPARRVCVAFMGGLTKAFAVEQCILGLETFFHEIYEDLRIEVPDLSKRIASELLPTLRSLLEVDDFERVAALQVHCFSFKRWESKAPMLEAHCDMFGISAK